MVFLKAIMAAPKSGLEAIAQIDVNGGLIDRDYKELSLN